MVHAHQRHLADRLARGPARSTRHRHPPDAAAPGRGVDRRRRVGRRRSGRSGQGRVRLAGRLVSQAASGRSNSRTATAASGPSWRCLRPSRGRPTIPISTISTSASSATMPRRRTPLHTYFGLRTIELGLDEKTARQVILLNGEPIYLRGALDQSFNPEGSLHRAERRVPPPRHGDRPAAWASISSASTSRPTSRGDCTGPTGSAC